MPLPWCLEGVEPGEFPIQPCAVCVGMTVIPTSFTLTEHEEDGSVVP